MQLRAKEQAAMITSSYLHPRYDIILSERGGVPVIVDAGYRRCTAFIIADVKNDATGQYERIPIATVFFLEVPHDLNLREDSGFTVYAITVRHAINRFADSEPIVIRVNDATGVYKDIETRKSDWKIHPETDIAIRTMPAGQLDGTEADWLKYEFISPYDEGAYSSLYEGDDVFSVGLFAGFSGQQRIQPIVRFGKIALTPHEKVMAQLDPPSDVETAIDAYLIECIAWDGQSGSPVFANFGPGRIQGRSTSEYERFEQRLPCLMGLIQGYYPAELYQQRINMGIAIVIPAQKIIDTLMLPELKDDRKRALVSRPKPKIRPVAASPSEEG
jgi:hypothetical protein